ncbi:hypothetical protein AwErysi_05680 [Erysipelotrichaceae bacterium]|nr:hypothetical protein AwErysi_05680 [Erysipelotrichaceae bacterium]
MRTEDISAVEIALKQGRIIAIATDTVYGLFVDGSNERAVQKLYELKQRPKTKSFILMSAQGKDIGKLGVHIPQYAQDIIEKCWPGALTCVFKREAQLILPFLENQNSIAIRMPNDVDIISLIMRMPEPIIATSANISGAQVLKTASDVEQEFGDAVLIWELNKGISTEEQSTIISCEQQNSWKLIRCGSIPKEKIWAILDEEKRKNT